MSGYLINDFLIGIDSNNINIIYSNPNFKDNNDNKYILNHSLRNYLKEIKKEIDKYPDKWDIYKKITNKYEYINTPIKINNNNICVCNYKPISRSYFKLIEILNYYNFNFSNDKINSFHLAEGPGGFIEALCNYRNNSKDNYVGITLMDKNHEIPKWHKILNFLKKNKNIKLVYGPQNDGNLYYKHNLDYFKDNYANKFDFITADGGFDYSSDFNKQEENSINLIYCEFLYAIICQKKGGSFILKMFDLFHRNSIDILYLLIYFYEYVYIYKPSTSREANSEKYIICINFKIPSNYDNIINKLTYNFTHMKNQKLTNIFDFKFNSYFINKIEEINAIFGQQQIENILSTISFIKENNNINKDKIEKIKQNNINKCIKWCKEHNIKINDCFKEM